MLGCHPQRITRFVAEGCPVGKRGRRGLGHLYSFDDVQGWLAAREDAKSGPGGDVDLVQERARKDRAQRHLAEQLLKTRAADLVAKDEVIAAWAAHVVAVKAKLSAIPAALDLQDANRARLAALIGEILDDLDRTVQPPAATTPKPRPKPAKPKRKATKGAAR